MKTHMEAEMFKCEAARSALMRAMILEREGFGDISAGLVEAAVRAEIGFLTERNIHRSASKDQVPVFVGEN
jgi:hypothetical protein